VTVPELFSQLAVLGSSLALICGLILLWRRSVHAYVTAFRWQSAVLAGVTAAIARLAGDPALYVVAVLLFLLKVVAIPMLLRAMERRFGAERELQPYVNAAASVLIAAILVVIAYIVVRPLVAISTLPTRGAMPLAMGLVFVSLFVIVSRKKALTQIIGFLMLENGIALLAVLGTYGIPLIVELGVFLDALMGFLVMQVFVYRIHETFESIDVEQLSRLRH
jgi:hydrogenase-4 component E